MLLSEMNNSVKNLLNLLNLLRGCKSISYKPKTLNNLNKFNKLPYLLNKTISSLLRLLRIKCLIIKEIAPLNSSTDFFRIPKEYSKIID